jgi:hypothetical protein
MAKFQKTNTQGLISSLFTSPMQQDQSLPELSDFHTPFHKPSKNEGTDKLLNNPKSIQQSAFGKDGIRSDVHNSKFLGCQSNNSILNSSILDNMPKSNDEITRETKQNIQRAKEGWKEENLQQIAQSLQNTDLRKGGSVASSHVENGQGVLRDSTRGMSILDNALNFSNVPELTPGEKAIQDAKQERAQRSQRETRPLQGHQTMQSGFQNFMQNLINKGNK